MFKECLFLPILFFCFFLPSAVTGQEVAERNSDPIQLIRNRVEAYQEEIRGGASIYQGREYKGYDILIEGNEFFESGQFTPASLRYDGVLYDLPLLFDLTGQRLVTLHPDGNFRIVLYSPRVNSFQLHGHTFEWLEAPTAEQTSFTTGFYDILYKGEVWVLVKREKTVREYTESGILERVFEQKNNFFLKKDHVFYPVKSKRSVLKLFGKSKKEIRRHLKKSKIKFRKEPERALVEIARFYDHAL